MFIYSLKASTLKFVAIVVISIGLLITLVSVIPNGKDSIYTTVAASENQTKVNYNNVKTNEDRVEFLKQFGYEVDAVALEEVEVVIPKDFDTVYKKYNEIQQMQSLNLEKFKNKKVERYTYLIKNYKDYDGDVFANILIYKNKVIGGDVCSAKLDGFMHGFDAGNKPTW